MKRTVELEAFLDKVIEGYQIEVRRVAAIAASGSTLDQSSIDSLCAHNTRARAALEVQKYSDSLGRVAISHSLIDFVETELDKTMNMDITKTGGVGEVMPRFGFFMDLKKALQS